MSRDWESWLQTASGPASGDEEQKRDRTETRIRDALDRTSEIPNKSIRVSVKGSYANSTNVRLDSDVDIAVEWIDGFKISRNSATKDLTNSDLGLVDAEIPSPSEFRAQVERALISVFGSDADTSGGKAITIPAGATTIDADVVPCFRMRRYDTRTDWHEGIRLFPRVGSSIDNYPQQHYDNGVKKNNDTGRRYKKIVRCLKRLENDMLERGIISNEVHSYLVECLVWNGPNTCFGHERLLDDLRAVFRSLWTPLKTDDGCHEWGEVNELKYLFRPSQRWTREQAFNFIDKAWDEVGVS